MTKEEIFSIFYKVFRLMAIPAAVFFIYFSSLIGIVLSALLYLIGVTGQQSLEIAELKQ